ncbi:MAG: hypothetical protein ACRELB_22125, partial [Polyangiaceae bacterium]
LRAGLVSSSACYPGQPSLPPTCAELQSAVYAQGRNFKLQVGFYAGAGALAAGAVTTWFLWPRRSAQSSWSIQPTFDARSGGAQVIGAF